MYAPLYRATSSECILLQPHFFFLGGVQGLPYGRLNEHLKPRRKMLTVSLHIPNHTFHSLSVARSLTCSHPFDVPRECKTRTGGRGQTKAVQARGAQHRRCRDIAPIDRQVAYLLTVRIETNKNINNCALQTDV